MTELNPINEIVAGVLRERGLDARTCYTRVTSSPPDGAAIVVECSDAGAADGIARRLAQQPGAARVRVATLPEAGVPAGLIAVSSVADVRREASHTSELVTQAVYGDSLAPLKVDGDWILVRMDDGYVGWVRSWHVTERSPARQADFALRWTHRVRANQTEAYADSSPRALPVSDLVVGTPLVATPGPARGWSHVEMPDGRAGFVRSVDLERRPSRRRATPERLISTGLRFLGIPYLWGGSTPKGFDCSGLIQRIFRLNGVILPRDSDMQARFGRERAVAGPQDLAPGDLVFFGRDEDTITHVGLVLPERRFLHAYGQVRMNSLDPADDGYDPALASIWRLTRDPLGS